MVLLTLAKAPLVGEDDEEPVDEQVLADGVTHLTTDHQTAGCELVLVQWLQIAGRYNLLQVYGSQTITKMLIEKEFDDQATTQNFINITGRLAAVLLNDKSAKEPTETYRQQLALIVERVGLILSWNLEHSLPFLDILYQRLLCLLEQEGMKAEILALVTHLLGTLHNGSGFEILHRLLGTCLGNDRKAKADHKLPEYLRPKRPLGNADLCPGELHRSFSELYAPLFILPVIKFQGRHARVSECLGMLI
jgi:hypothetical protein